MAGVVDQFRNLNTRDPGSWPALPKLLLLVAILVGVLVIAYFIDWQGQLEELEAGRAQEAKLKQEYRELRRVVSERLHFDKMIGVSKEIQKVFAAES